MTTDTSEKGLETLIVASLTGRESETGAQSGKVHYAAPGYGSGGYTEGDPRDYDRDQSSGLSKAPLISRGNPA
jgi:type I restriction enzyme R subunit